MSRKMNEQGWSMDDCDRIDAVRRALDDAMRRYIEVEHEGGARKNQRRGIVRGLARAVCVMVDGANVDAVEQESRRRVG